MHNRYPETILTTSFSELSKSNAKKIVREIKEQPDKYFIDNSEFSEFPEYLISKYKVNSFPDIHWKETQIELGKTQIPISDLPNSFDRFHSNEMISINTISYHIPVENDTSLLKYCCSNKFSSAHISGNPHLIDNFLVFTLKDYYSNSEKIDNEFRQTRDNFIKKLGWLEDEIKNYNIQTPAFIISEIKKRLKEIEKMNEYKSQFSFPIKKKEDVPYIFRKQNIIKGNKIIPKPVSNNSKSEERYISEEDFENILELLQACGKNWEQHPSTYRGKGEDALRDQLIFALAPNIEGVVSGEAYNKKGKTDISIKCGTNNLFIGECKIWKGSVVLTKTIDQILGYLTWRDTKSAIMMFVPNSNISNVSEETKRTVKEHPNFVRELKTYNPSWVNYKFHLSGDLTSYLTIAIQLYHLPELQKK